MEEFIELYNTDTLEGMKSYVNQKIDKKISSDIRAGFTFDGVLFSMSDAAQINWTNIPFIPEAMFPIIINAKDDSQTYNLSFANRLLFWGAALQHKNTALQTGNTLKASVRNATTIEECQNILLTLV